jgi:dihydrofolate synthase/folylpolyglutamate synthase
VIARRCAEVEARLVEVDAVWSLKNVNAASDGCYRAAATSTNSGEPIVLESPLAGRFQLRNALTATAAARLLAERGFPVTDAAIASGIASVRWPGRLERMSERPAVYLDGTHNTEGARELLKFWKENLAGRRIWLVYGAMRDKAVDEIAGLLFPAAEAVILTEARQPRAISAPLLAEMAGHHARKFTVVSDPFEALDRAIEMAQPEDVVFATGSLYLVGDLRGHLVKRFAHEVRSAESNP